MRIVAHIDMDAFYAAVEERRNPGLCERPVVVGADPRGGKGRGVVTTANYHARRFGIRSALPISRAWRLAEAARERGAPATVFIEPDFALYREVSARIMGILEQRGDGFEEASIDECYLELSSLGTFDAAALHMIAVKTEIRDREGLTCSVGLGPNKLVAKIASDRNKPDGLTVVTPDRVGEFLDPLPVRVLPGVGSKAEAFLHARGVRTVAHLRSTSESTLSEWFGKPGVRLFDKARGIDDSPVSNDWTRKSIGQQETLQQDTRSSELLASRLDRMAQRLLSELRENHFSGFRTITLIVRFSDFQTKSRSRSMSEPILADPDGAALEALRTQARALLAPFFDLRENPRRKAIRLIGLRLEKLV